MNRLLGVNAAVSPSLLEEKDKLPSKVWNQIENYYQFGQYQAVSEYITELIANKEVDKSCVDILAKYRKDLIKFYTSDCHAFTTHSLLQSFDYWHLKKYDAVIFDEDPIYNYMLMNQAEIPMSKLNQLLAEITGDRSLDPDGKLAKKIRLAVEAAKTTSYITLPQIKYVSAYTEISIPIEISAFCHAQEFYVKKKTDETTLTEDSQTEDSFIFFKPFKLHHNIKYIIMSATVDERICKCLFGGNRVKFYKCNRAEYIGTVNQYPELPMSRSFMDSYPGILQDIIKFSGFDDVITFKKYGIGAYHYGKTTGINTLKGKNLTLVGTPHHPEWLYVLFARTIGWRNIYGDNKPPKMRYQRVKHNGRAFWFMTFDDEFLRHIQFWMIETELEQSLGRCRPGRTPAVINVFSNFPLLQAKQKRLPEHILNKYKKDTE